MPEICRADVTANIKLASIYDGPSCDRGTIMMDCNASRKSSRRRRRSDDQTARWGERIAPPRLVIPQMAVGASASQDAPTRIERPAAWALRANHCLANASSSGAD